MVLAQEEARALNHNFIGTEHLLLGLLREDDGAAAQALSQLGISLEAVRQKVEARVVQPPVAAGGYPPFSLRAKKALEQSLREALQLGHNYIGTEHLLLGLVRVDDSGGARVLADLGADPRRVRAEVISVLNGQITGDELLGEPLPACPGCRRPLEEVAHRAVPSTAVGPDAIARSECR